MPARKRTSSGFSLLELVLVMMILAIIAGMAAPSMRGFAEGRRGPDTASQLVTMMRWAHSQARAESQVYRLTIDQAQGQYWVSAEDPATGESSEEMQYEKHALPEGVRLTSDLPPEEGRLVVRFYPNGRTDVGTIRVETDSGAPIELVCLSAAENYHIASASEARR